MDKGSGSAFVSAAENWEIQVDRVFISLTESYLCYHVVEPKQAKILMQDLTFVTDDIKVYTESGYPVVVGDNDAVKDRIAILEKSLPTWKELPIAERQFKVVEEEFSREICTHCPEVKIHRGNATIILEGPDKEVKLGATKLDELIRKVKEKRVKLPTAILTFLTSSGAISKYQAHFQQSLRNLVSIEVGSDLVLSSLSADALDEAEAALQRDLSLDNVQLQGAAAVPPDLDRVKEILMKAKNEANLRELRVDVSFIPGPSGAAVQVRLVGYSENVIKLKELLHNYQMNQTGTQELLSLPHPELVDCFHDVLKMIGMKQNKVTFKASHFPYPSVLVSGPRCLVKDVQTQLNATLASLTKDTLVLGGPAARRYFQEEGKMNKELVESCCQVIIREQQGVSGTTSSPGTTTVTPRLSFTRLSYNTAGSTAVNKTSLEIKLGNLVDEQVNVLVAPMINGQLASTNIGSCLIKKAGNAINSKFDSAAANRTFAPGDVLQVDAPPSLGCSKLFFIECFPWDGVRGQSMQALGKGLKTCLDLCVQQRVCSVAFPIIGPGILLKYPLRVAIEVLTENIRLFGLSASTGSLSSIHIVIKPGYPDSEECYHDVYKHLSSNINQGGQAIFKSLTSDLDDITMTVGGGVKLQLVFGDITNEITDVVVNTTDFANFQNDGVCKDILTVAGPEVEAELRAANVKKGEIFVSESGSFPCDALLHVCGEKDAGIVEQLVCDIIRHCENYGFMSVAIPAICAGAGGLDPGVVAGAILRGVKAATSSTSLYSLTNIRLVLIKINVFLAFKEEATQMFPTAVINRVSVPQRPHVQQQQQQPPSLSVSTDLSILHSTSTSQKSVFVFLGLSRQDVDNAMTKLKDTYQAQCSTQTFRKEDLVGLTQDDLEDLRQLVESHGLYIQRDQSGQGSLTVSGLKDGVNQVTKKINDSMQENLRREVRAREEEELFSRVVWCILGNNGNWERLPKTANYKLENNDIAGGVVDAQGTEWSVDAQRSGASRPISGQTTKLKRLGNLPDFTLPLEWDNMAAGESFKVVALQPSSAEYKSVKEGFKRTVAKTVMKIERLQNVHLRRAYEAQKKQISDNRRQEGGAFEKLLYHGTTQENCDSIMKTGFNRRFAGQNATVYGHGTYFAVNASYSAHPTYSKPAADGSQLMFVARVLTGVYTLGSGDMKVPPPRSNSQPHDRCDSVVDKIDNPSMYVVFHDNQAYPDYLITFK
uniref:Poly [ADP-ribose] polymerase n=1 Tax=Sparus aurata TaxID=8175 RepID=A0A671W1H6_SPAAU